MDHVYAPVTTFHRRLNGDSVAFDWAAASVPDLLACLAASSRRVDEFCNRSRGNVSGFGPRIGTNRYDGSGGRTLRLWDDLLALTSVTVLDGTNGAETALTDETDYFAAPYDRDPKRELILHGDGSHGAWPRGLRTVAVAAAWGHASRVRRLAATTAEALDATETAVDVSDLAEFSPGHTLLIGAEQMLVTAGSEGTPDTLTVERGVNGTTAATHVTSSPIDVYTYVPKVTDATLRIGHRRWRAFEAGLTGDFGGPQGAPQTGNRDNEWSILRSTVGHLRLGSSR